jgi:hypothetical protein
MPTRRSAGSATRWRDWIRRAEALLSESRRSPAETGSAALRAVEAMSAAAARVDAVALDGDTLALDLADSLLNQAAATLTRDRYTVQYARLERERGRVAALRWSLGGNAGHWIAAYDHMGAATEALTASQDAPFRRVVQASSGWLAGRPTQRPTLSDPILWP